MPQKAIISDVHGNFKALYRVLYDIIVTRGIPRQDIYSLGDLVSYYPGVDECVDAHRTLDIETVIGNHDLACIDKNFKGLESFNPAARAAVEYSRKALSDKNREFLEKLSYVIDKRGYWLVHANPVDPQSFYYIGTRSHGVDIGSVLAKMDEVGIKIVFIGHSHYRMLLEDGNKVDIQEGLMKLDENKKYIINVGAVGQPRDKNPDASYVVFNEEDNSVQFIRLPYSIKEAQEAVKAAEYGQIPITQLEATYGKSMVGEQHTIQQAVDRDLFTAGEFLAARLEVGM